MNSVKQELKEKIEEARQELNHRINQGMAYDLIYEQSVALDHWIAQYIAAGF